MHCSAVIHSGRAFLILCGELTQKKVLAFIMQGSDSEVMCKITWTLQSIIVTYFHTGWLEKESNGMNLGVRWTRTLHSAATKHFQTLFLWTSPQRRWMCHLTAPQRSALVFSGLICASVVTCGRLLAQIDCSFNLMEAMWAILRNQSNWSSGWEWGQDGVERGRGCKWRSRGNQNDRTGRGEESGK